MKVRILIGSLFLLISFAHASGINEQTGNIRYNYLEDERTGNFSIKEWPRDCARFAETRSEAGQDAIKRCEAESQGKCVFDSGSENRVSQTVIAEADRDRLQSIEAQGFSASIDPDAYYFAFNYETEQWFVNNCPQALPELLKSLMGVSQHPELGRNDSNRSPGKETPAAGNINSQSSGTSVSGQ